MQPSQPRDTQEQDAQSVIALAIENAPTEREADLLRVLAEESRLRFRWQGESFEMKAAMVAVLERPDAELREAIESALRASKDRGLAWLKEDGHAPDNVIQLRPA
jgi:hypothetical protein